MKNRLISAALLGALVAHAAAARAQDIEVTAELMGRRLPEGYYDRIRQQPDFFEVRHGWLARASAAAEARAAVTGELPVVVIQALFSDSQDPAITHDDVSQVLFDGPYENGTITEYYTEVSGGRFTVAGQVLPWVRTSLTMAQTVGSSFGLGGDAQTGTYLLEALQLVDPTVDFAQFDSDGPDGMPNSGDDDGVVDAVAFQFLEVSASCGGPAIWPHRAGISFWTEGTPYTTDDLGDSGEPIVVDDYVTQSTVNCAATEIHSPSTFAHELGHVLGLPDLYDRSQGILPEERRWVVGCWSLMAAGTWGCGTMNVTPWVRPTHMGPWEKSELGWLTTEEIVGAVQGQEFTLQPVQTSGHVLRVPINDTEYFLVEYREKSSFDVDLPVAGVLIYHVDTEIPGNQPNPDGPQIYRVALEEADGNAALARTFLEGGNRGEPGDAFAATQPARFSGSTIPSTRSNAGVASGITFYSIAVEDGVARLTISTILIAADRLLQPFLRTAANGLTTGELEYLDGVGNGNGRYDVGDLRAYLKR